MADDYLTIRGKNRAKTTAMLKRSGYASGGKTGDMGLYTDSGEPFDAMTQSASSMSASEADGRKSGTKDYARIKRVQDSAVQPVRAIRKATDYIGEKYGDVRDSARSAISGDPKDAEFRAGQRAVRKKVLGYAKGGRTKKGKKK